MSKRESVFDFIKDLKKQVSDCEHEAESCKANSASSATTEKAKENLSKARIRFSDALFLTLLWIYTLPTEDSLIATQKLTEIIDLMNS